MHGPREALIYSEPVKYVGHKSRRHHEANDVRLAGLRTEEETDAPGVLPGCDGEGRTLGSAAGRDRAALPDDRPARSSTDAARDDAADLLHAAVVHAVGSGDGGRAV